MKSRQPTLVSAIVLVLMLVSGHHLDASTMSFSADTPSSVPAADHGCTSFCLNNNGYCVFGTNFDNTIHEGLLFVNKRNVSKIGWETNTAGESVHWMSKYGSFTFNLVGYQLVWAGMNEAGLMISTMALGESRAADPDERFPLVGPLWIQYQLDNYSTVEEVIASESLVRLTAAHPLTADHYLVCDRSGDCATIEFLQGEMVYHTGETLPAAALTNNVYDESVRAWQENNLSDGSLIRFATAADRVTGFEPMDSQEAVEYAFETLTRVSDPDWTKWSIVFDPENLRILFRTRWNSRIRHIDFSELDFSCGTPEQMLNAHEELSGDVSDDLVPYSRDVNLEHLENVLEKLGFDAPRDQTEALVRQLEGFSCMGESGENVMQEKSRDFSWLWLVAAVVLVIIPIVVWYGLRRKVRQD